MPINKKSTFVLPIRSDEATSSVSAALSVPGNEQQQQLEGSSPIVRPAAANSEDCLEPSERRICMLSTLWLQKQWKSAFHTPKGVCPQHFFIVSWLGRLGFIAKGIVYAVMGGLCIATAQHLKGDITGTESPMGAFVFLGLFSIGTPILVVMFIGILFYSVWRFWEGTTGQGYDAQCSHFSNFFRARLSPIVSGIVYIVYLVYIGKLLAQTRDERMKSAVQSTGCFPSCWASSNYWVYRMAVGVFGVAFVIACITQAQNGFSNRWHKDLKVEERSKIEKYIVYFLGHLGFLARSGVFMFVAVFMFKTLRHPTMVSERDAFSDAINQVISAHGGFIGLWFLGIGLILFGAFAVLNAYYKYFPTPPPSRKYVYDERSEIKSASTSGNSVIERVESNA